jgi:hypothetical protein
MGPAACASPAAGKLQLEDMSGRLCGNYSAHQSGILFHVRLRNRSSTPVTVDNIRFRKLENGRVIENDLTTINATPLMEPYTPDIKLGSAWEKRVELHGATAAVVPPGKWRDINLALTRIDPAKPMIGRDVSVTYTADGATSTESSDGLIFAATSATGHTCRS